jgi:hypothetical protein
MSPKWLRSARRRGFLREHAEGETQGGGSQIKTANIESSDGDPLTAVNLSSQP